MQCGERDIGATLVALSTQGAEQIRVLMVPARSRFGECQSSTAADQSIPQLVILMTRKPLVETADFRKRERRIEKFPLSRSLYEKRWPGSRMRSNMASHQPRSVTPKKSRRPCTSAASSRSPRCAGSPSACACRWAVDEAGPDLDVVVQEDDDLRVVSDAPRLRAAAGPDAAAQSPAPERPSSHRRCRACDRCNHPRR